MIATCEVSENKILRYVRLALWAGYRSRYSDWLRGSNPGGGEIFRTCPDWSWGPSSLLYNGYQVFHGGKQRPGRDADPSPPSSTLVKKE